MMLVTTSWDDGHPLDRKLAELLMRYAVPATFYIPRACEGRPVLGPAQIRELGQHFEIGAHTISHRRLTSVPTADALFEIAGSRHYIEDATGKPCTVFAPPGGKFAGAHLEMAASAGLRGFRTTELMNLGRPKWRRGLALIPTTLQVYPHRMGAYLRNAIRRLQPAGLWRAARHARRADLHRTFDSLLADLLAASRPGQVLHLWGHSWEIEEQNAWPALEFMLARIAERRDAFTFASNSDLCQKESALRP